MATDRDDDMLDGPVPAPDAPPSAAERAHAKTFADLVDKTLAGRTPPAMSADDRALLEVATVIRAAAGNVELPAARQRSAVEDALRLGAGGAGTSGSVAPIARGRTRRWAPWLVASGTSALAAAAVLVLWLRPVQRVTVTAPAELPTAWRSRPADPLVGRIARGDDADAATRIDAIFADRLDGYRDRELGGGKP
ncbi:MAG TPA: hypothetical protein VLX92_08715 [Kofleriaceae bacterium]|nr:hypothetical protein [Kofleriaceae bacterium]